ncbi:MAG: histidine phosphatase family protein [Phycicoccus sp.]|nr:histidine phosphatase family protein [Phycicoccus sp.]NMM33276.1 histidine phosphatase family protein [Phycicoccus sp.]
MPAPSTSSTSALTSTTSTTSTTSNKKAGRRLIVWRHGETDHNAGGIWQGQLDTALSATGREQAKVAAVALAAYSPVTIVSSDLERAADTATALASLVGLQVRFDERLREIHAGQWQGMTAGDVAEQFPEEQAALMAGDDIQRGIDGESLGQVAERARAAIDELLPSLAPGECAVIVTHGVAGRVIVASLVDLDQHLAWQSIGGLHNCHWAELREYAGGWRIAAWNVGPKPL